MSIDPHESDQEPGNPDTWPSIDGYTIIRKVARAGQGVVYQAIQRSTNQEVALKTLRNDRPLPESYWKELK